MAPIVSKSYPSYHFLINDESLPYFSLNVSTSCSVNPVNLVNGPGSRIVNSSKSDTADSEPSFFIGSIPVMYAAATTLGVKFLFLNHSLSRSRYDCCVSLSSLASLITASHSSITKTNSLLVMSTHFLIQSDISKTSFSSGYSDTISSLIPAVIKSTRE